MTTTAGSDEVLAAKFASVFPHLNERQRQLMAGAEARALGRGGIARVARASGLHPETVTAGMAELASGAPVSERVRAELVCLHPFTNRVSSPFRLYSETGADFALAGAVDISCTELFARTLERATALGPGPDLVIDRARADLHRAKRSARAGPHRRRARTARGAAWLDPCPPASRAPAPGQCAGHHRRFARPRAGRRPGGSATFTRGRVRARDPRGEPAFARYSAVANKAAYGVRPTEGATITELYLRGPLSPTELARCVQLTTAGMTEILDRLERAGHLRRDPHPSDRRKVVVSLTPSAVGLIEREAPTLVQLLAPLLDAGWVGRGPRWRPS